MFDHASLILRTRQPQFEALDTVTEVLAYQPPVEDTAERTLRQALSQSVMELIAMLKTEDKELLEAIDIGGEPQTHYAARTGLNYSTVKSRLQCARRRLRAQLRATRQQTRLLLARVLIKKCGHC